VIDPPHVRAAGLVGAEQSAVAPDEAR
jgi:hypothetical protein